LMGQKRGMEKEMDLESDFEMVEIYSTIWYAYPWP